MPCAHVALTWPGDCGERHSGKSVCPPYPQRSAIPRECSLPKPLPAFASRCALERHRDHAWQLAGTLKNTGNISVELARFHYLQGTISSQLGLLQLEGSDFPQLFRHGDSVPAFKSQTEEMWRKYKVFSLPALGADPRSAKLGGLPGDCSCPPKSGPNPARENGLPAPEQLLAKWVFIPRLIRPSSSSAFCWTTSFSSPARATNSKEPSCGAAIADGTRSMGKSLCGSIPRPAQQATLGWLSLLVSIR